MNSIVAPSVLSCDFANIQQESNMLNESEADWFHLDVMDGVFVPNISFGLPIIKAFRGCTNKTLDVHAMIANPDDYVDDFKAVGTDILTVHFEACKHLHRTINAIKATGMKAGVALNPHTPVAMLESIIHDIDLVLIMSVNPGFGGQSFIDNTYTKVTNLKKLIAKTNSNALIEIDGGVTTANAEKLSRCGADILVAGSSVFRTPSISEAITALHG